MSVEIRLPNITGDSTPAQLAQIKSYLYQMVGQLNYALSNMDSSAVYVNAYGASASARSSSGVPEDTSASDTLFPQ